MLLFQILKSSLTINHINLLSLIYIINTFPQYVIVTFLILVI